jgi:hypothetical protein
MSDAQRYRRNAADCLSATERCGPAYRDLTLAIASSWLSLSRHQEAMDGLLTIWSRAQSAAPFRPAAFLTVRGTPNYLKGGQQDREIFMSSGTHNRARAVDRYRQIAAEYADLSKDSTDPFLRPYYLRIAEGYGPGGGLSEVPVSQSGPFRWEAPCSKCGATLMLARISPIARLRNAHLRVPGLR